MIFMPVVIVRGHVIIESLVLGTNYIGNMGPDVTLFLFSEKIRGMILNEDG